MILTAFNRQMIKLFPFAFALAGLVKAEWNSSSDSVEAWSQSGGWSFVERYKSNDRWNVVYFFRKKL